MIGSKYNLFPFQSYYQILENIGMKLTIKRKNQEPTSQNTYTGGNYGVNRSPCCNLDEQGKRHVFYRPHNKQQKLLYDLIKIDCQLVYSKVSPTIRADNLQTTIVKILSEFRLHYQPWIGYLCTHCCHHFQSELERMNIIRQFVLKFRPAFEEKPCADFILSQTFKRLRKYCSETRLEPEDSTLISICQKYQQTLLLEFLPVKYSEYIIQRYLSNDGDIQQYVRLCTSLAHFVLDFANPIKQAHFLDLMYRPYMGTVEWPVIIANRSQFSEQPLNSPILQKI